MRNFSQTLHETAFSKPTDKGVQCGICPHACNLSEGQYGLCHSRVNHGGILYSEAYANPCAIHIDPVEKKPLLHFYPGCRCLSIASCGCNFACLNCQNWDISQAKPSEIESVTYPPEKILASCLANHCPAIAYTYTEPITFYEYTYDTAVLAHQSGIQNILVSAGYINEQPLKELCKVIDAANIDLKSFSDELYAKINRGHLAPVLNTLKTLKDAGIWLEITNLLIPTVNDDKEMLKAMCNWLVTNGFENSPLHFSRYYPMYKMQTIGPTPLETLVLAREIAIEEGMNYVYIGNVNEIDGENTFCPSCHKLLVRRNGFSVWESHITDGECGFCGSAIPGRW